MVERHGVDIVVAEATARFRGSARFDDEIELRATVTRLGTTGMTTALAVARDGDVLVEGELRHVFVDATTWEKTPIPDAVRAALAAVVRGRRSNLKACVRPGAPAQLPLLRSVSVSGTQGMRAPRPLRRTRHRAQDPRRSHGRHHGGARPRPGRRSRGDRQRCARLRPARRQALPAPVAEQRVHRRRRAHRHRPPREAAAVADAEEREGPARSTRPTSTAPTASAPARRSSPTSRTSASRRPAPSRRPTCARRSTAPSRSPSSTPAPARAR